MSVQRGIFSHRPRGGGLGLLLVILLGASAVRAADRLPWTFAGAADFQAGEFRGTTLTSEGAIALAFRIDELLAVDAPYLWSGAVDPKGNLYVGGAEGTVTRIASDGTVETVYTGDQGQQVQALALDAAGNLYVGINPDGQVIRVPAKGDPDVWFESGQTYVWSLLPAPDGGLYVATGEEGAIYRVEKDGTTALFYEGDETHFTHLTWDPDGRLLAVGQRSGALYRFDASGRPFVLYQLERGAIVDLLVLPEGDCYLAVVGASASQPPRSTITNGAPGRPASARAQTAAGRRRGRRTPGRLIRLSADGVAQTLWSSRDEPALSVAWHATAGVVLGTGNRGRCYAVADQGRVRVLADLAAAQVAALVALPDGGVAAVTSNSGKVFQIQARRQPEGEYRSQALDARTAARWGKPRWNGAKGQGAEIDLYFRQGNTPNPGHGWTPWERLTTRPPTGPPARYGQWRVVMRQGEETAAPLFHRLEIIAQQVNLPPVLKAVRVQPVPVPLSHWTGIEADEEADRKRKSNKNGDPTPGGDGPCESEGGAPRMAVTWEASDPNGDPLTATLYLQAEGDRGWTRQAGEVTEPGYCWHTASVADGQYRLRVVVDDGAENPPSARGETVAETRWFVVDHTPPVVEGLTVSVEKGEAIARWNVTDAFSPLARLEARLDAEPWVVVTPQDGILDGLEELCVLRQEVAPGAHTLFVRVLDEAGNLGAGRVTFTTARR